MKTLYCSVHLASKDFEKIFKKYPNRFENVAQKFNNLMCCGLAENLKQKVDVLSTPPAFIPNFFAKDDYSRFFYVPSIEIPIIRYFLMWIYMFLFTLIWNILHIFSKRVVYIAATTLLKFLPVYLISRLFGAKLVLVTCDIPSMTFSQRLSIRAKKSLGQRLHSFIANSIWSISSHFSYYILLTKEMNQIVNKRNKPYVVIEGFSDVNMKSVNPNLNDKYEKNTIVFAGGLYEKYGVKMLAEAVESLQDDNVELLLLGKGEMEKTLKDTSYRHVKYLGSRLNSEVLDIERKSTLLVNPRSSKEQYTRYSFPSKIIEYMSTGTLTLITKLGGIPHEYFDYCEVIEDESVEGLRNSIIKVLNMSPLDRYEKGMSAREYVLQNKNNVVQTQKIIKLIENNVNF